MATKKLTPKQRAFLDWLCTPEAIRQPRTQREWCKQNQVNEQTARRWKQDPEFARQWNLELRKLEVDPENIAAVVKAMRDKALMGDMKAAVEYLKIADRFFPDQEEVDSSTERPLASLSDDELDALLADEIAAERAARVDPEDSGADPKDAAD